MSNISALSDELSFWDFVFCSRCQLPFASDSTVPFWVTECGHVVCNTHLTTDRSCTQCGLAGVQLLLLQREMEVPMSIIYALDTVAYTAKIQQETMAFQIRYYKNRQRQQQALISRLKWDMNELERNHSALAQENDQFRQYLGYEARNGEPAPSSTADSHGTRGMSDLGQYMPGSSKSRSTVTSLGPGGPTAPLPSLISDGAEQQNLAERSLQHARPPQQTGLNPQRPDSSRHSRQHSYVPPSTAQSSAGNRRYSYIPPSTAQPFSQTPRRQVVSRRGNQNRNPQPSQERVRGMVPAVPFEPAQRTPARNDKPSAPGRPSRPSTHSQNAAQTQSWSRNMGPPVTPQQVRQRHPAALPPSAPRRTPSYTPNNGFRGPSSRFTPQSPLEQRYPLPSTSIGAQRFPAAGANSGRPESRACAPSRAATPAIVNNSGGGMRVPLFP